MNTSDISTQMDSGIVQQVPPTRRHATRTRVQEHLPRLVHFFRKLYPEPDDSQYLNRLLEIMAARISERSDELFELDEQRTAQPDWLTQSRHMGYMAYTDRLAGSLKSVADRIPHLKSLGITYLHLLPFLKARQGENDGGFAVASFNEVEPALGTRQDLAELTARLRQADISLCSDIVLNHVADDHEWVQKARAGDSRYQGYFHLIRSADDVAAYEATLNQVFPETAPGNFTRIDALDAWAWTTFYPYQWDLNYSNPAVFIEMVDAMLDLANLGIEAFRLDSAGYLWKQRGTACMNLPQTHDILKCMRACMAIAAPAVLLKAEAIVPTRELPPYFGMTETPAPECHLAYHSSLMTAIWLAISEQRSDIIQRVLSGTPRLPEGCSWVTYIRCHDDIGWNVLKPELEEAGDTGFLRLRRAAGFMAGHDSASFASGETFQATDPNRVHGTNGMTASLLGLEKVSPRETLARLNLVFGLITCVGGLPLIYMGDEWAQGNASDVPDGTWAAEDGRRLQRPFWDSALVSSSPQSIHQRQLAQIRQWQHIRSTTADLAAHAPLTLLETGHDSLLAFKRGQSTIVIANLSGTGLTVTPDIANRLHLSRPVVGAWTIRLEKCS